jgi:two-component system cell cycle response regulator
MQALDLHQQGFSARINALEDAEHRLRDRAPEALSAIRRIAHSLYISGDVYDNPEVKQVILALKEMKDEDIPISLHELLAKLRALASVQDAHSKKIGILLIDDDPFLAEVLRKRLTEFNREIFVASQATEAEKIIEEKDIALVLLDIMLPDADGRNLLIRLRERFAPSTLPIVVLSAKKEPNVQTECFALGADAYFSKPVDPSTLSAALANYLQRTADYLKRSSRDSLTGLPNREALGQAFTRAVALAFRTKDPLTLAIVDIDRFKSVNDCYGHSVGDLVLRRVCAVISRSLRASDFLARWGGEEFVILFLNTSLPSARLALDKALTALGAEVFKTQEGQSFRVTFSAGVAQVREGETIEQTIAHADRFLYHAKALGRNRVLTETDNITPSKKKILLIEDDARTADEIQYHLERIGLSVLHATDAAGAASVTSKTSISMILIDVNICGTDGFKLLESLRGNPSLGRMPIAMLTTAGNQEHVNRGFQLGVDDCIRKPVAPQELLTHVRRLLG